MATNLGKVGIVMKGDWSSSETYEVLDAVSYSGSLYIAKQNVPANTLPTNTTYWQLAINTGYPKTAIEVTPAEGWTLYSNNSYRIGDVCYIDCVVYTTDSVTSRTHCCTLGSNAAPSAVERFTCCAAATATGSLLYMSTGFLANSGRKISVGDNNPGAKSFAIRFSYVI